MRRIFGTRAGVAMAAIGACALLLALAVGVIEGHHAVHRPLAGWDMWNLRHAGEQLRAGERIYADPIEPPFVYPPTAAVASVLLTLGSPTTILYVFVAICAVAILVAAFISVAPWRGDAWWVVAAVSAGLMMRSDALHDNLWLANVSLVLAPVAVGILLLFESNRWTAGCALLMASLLLKPLLLPLVVIPLFRRQWRPVVVTAVPAVVVLLVAIVAIPGGSEFFAVQRFVSSGSGLTGSEAVYNSSLRGVADRLDEPTIGIIMRLVVGLLAVGVLVLWARSSLRPGGIAAAGTFLLCCAFMAGPVSEGHYLLVAVPCLLVALALYGRMQPLLWAIPALVVFFVPRGYIGWLEHSPETVQLRYLTAVLLVAVAAGAILWQMSKAETATPRPSRS